MPKNQRQRMEKLRQLLAEQKKKGDIARSLANQAAEAKEDYNRARIEYENCMDDLIGDLFSGCFGQEWLLEDV